MAIIAGIILGVLVFILIELRSLNENLCEFTRVGYRIEKLLNEKDKE